MKKLLAMLLALVLALSMLTLAVFAESTTDEEEVVEAPEVDVEEVPEENPTTGLALALVPMAVAGAAVAISKKH